jgi:aspartate aminotransferase
MLSRMRSCNALGDLDPLSIDLGQLQQKRNFLVTALREMGYIVHMPEATFYLLPRSPWPDDVAFVDLLGEHRILALPGTIAEIPGHFRLSLTASDAMIERALPGFASAIARARANGAQTTPLATAMPAGRH